MPAELYGRLSHLVAKPQISNPDQSCQSGPDPGPITTTRPRTRSKSPPFKEVRHAKNTNKPISQLAYKAAFKPQPPPMAQSIATPQSQDRPRLRISLTKGLDGDWSTNADKNQANVQPPPTSSIVNNVSSFLQGMRATFRQDNIIVSASQHEIGKNVL